MTDGANDRDEVKRLEEEIALTSGNRFEGWNLNAVKSETVYPANAPYEAFETIANGWSVRENDPIDDPGPIAKGLTEANAKLIRDSLNASSLSSQAPPVVRCSSCDGTVMYKRDGNNVTIMHGCLSGKQAREVYARAELSSQAIASAAKEAAWNVISCAIRQPHLCTRERPCSSCARELETNEAIIVAAYEKARTK